MVNYNGMDDDDMASLSWADLNQRIGAKDAEIERLRAWVFCPEHGPLCGGDECCCIDRHQPELARHQEAREL